MYTNDDLANLIKAQSEYICSKIAAVTTSSASTNNARDKIRDKINALIAEIYGITPADRSYSREEVITYLQRALTSPVA